MLPLKMLGTFRQRLITVLTALGFIIYAPLLVGPYGSALAGSPSGAIFTTTPNGAIVNENVHYTDKRDVYLDGGPPPNAPQTAAGLPDGRYVFQVTDPSGQFLLSRDPARCRVVEVKGGIIVLLVPPTALGISATTNNWEDGPGKPPPCHIQDIPDGAAGPSGQHDTNTDIDHGGSGAIVVQLMPYGTTPNPGGVYKAWMIPLQTYTGKGGQLNNVPVAIKGKAAQPCPDFCAAADPGFGPPRGEVKTDNFKVRLKGPPPQEAPKLTVIKFHDANLSCVKDSSEAFLQGWKVDITDPLSVTQEYFTDSNGEIVVLAAPSGTWTVLEDIKSGTAQTSSRHNANPLSCINGNPAAPNPTVTVNVAGTSGETHTVIYGNVGLGEIKACKVFDRNQDGPDAGDPPVSGWSMKLSGMLLGLGGNYGPVTQTTGSDGCTTFNNLLPGDYTLDEGPLPSGWSTTGLLTSNNIEVRSTLVMGVPTGTVVSPVTFANFCGPFTSRGFGTKGYWHNKNGLSELRQSDIDYANGLAPYSSPSSYFGAGDEPFDGVFANNTQVAACNNTASEILAPAGSPKAEVCLFLIDPNAGGDPREQLAQQLLAFIFNARLRLGGVGGSIIDSCTGITGSVLVQDILNAAITAWQNGAVVTGPFTGKTANQMQEILDCLNNRSNGVSFIPGDPTGCNGN